MVRIVPAARQGTRLELRCERQASATVAGVPSALIRTFQLPRPGCAGGREAHGFGSATITTVQAVHGRQAMLPSPPASTRPGLHRSNLRLPLGLDRARRRAVHQRSSLEPSGSSNGLSKPVAGLTGARYDARCPLDMIGGARRAFGACKRLQQRRATSDAAFSFRAAMSIGVPG